jgi:NTE family protein
MLLRAGVPASDLAAWSVKAPLTAERQLLHELVGDEAPDLEPFRARELLRRPPHLPGVGMVTRAVARPWQFRPMAAALALMAPGRRDIVQALSALTEVDGQAWPEEDLWVCVVRRRDGRRVVLGRQDAPRAPLHLAIAASCAVPGFFAPVRIGDRTYLDGGAHSPTNADVLRRRRLDLVIVVSPMSGPAGRLLDPFAAMRRRAARTARAEVAALRRSGTQVVVLRPGADEQAVIGNDLMSRHRLGEVVQQSFLATGAHAARPEVREGLSQQLQRRRPARHP